ncbi:MAG: N-acetylglucosamine-6-phosphate deacetylase [Lachnospiraceae bacterium]|nr:N-acetylglucosamine-6-phosphate deacetylase [Lachnospiraceae bacterium]
MLLKNGSVFVDGKFIPADLLVTGGKISALWTYKEKTGQNYQGEETIDCTGKMIWPGLFDLHTHGCLGYDFSKSNPEKILKMCSFYAEHGVTSVLATTMTNEETQYAQAMCHIRQAIKEQARGRERSIGARIQGIHMEGPFFSPAKKGAHSEKYLRPLSQSLLNEYQKLSGNAIRLLALDPSLPGAPEFIRDNKEFLTISIAHTDCDYETAMTAANAGATHVTHLFNAMRPLLHRAPGVVGAAFTAGLNAEIICDGIHVHPAVVGLVFSAMPDHILLISDSINPTGLPDGNYEAGGLPVKVKDHRAYLPDGTLAGSTITLYDAVKNAVHFHVPLEKALLAATALPAKAIGLEGEVGSIACGRDADLLIVNEGLTLEKVMVGGKFLGHTECRN